MKITKAVITAAAPSQQKLPLQTLIDKDGVKRSVLEMLVNEVISAGIAEIGIVVQPDDIDTFTQVVGEHAHRVTFIPQDEAKGYGYALHLAKPFVKNEAFLHLVGDHLYVNRSSSSIAKELINLAEQHDCAISAVQPTRESLIPQFGVVGGSRYQQVKGVYKVSKVIEKPTPTEAEQKLIVPGLRAGHYLCFFGMHVLTPQVLNIIERELENGNSKVNLSFALNELATKELYLALEKQDLRFDMGEKYGLLKAQMALALNGEERGVVLSEMLELLAMNDFNRMGR